jgi:hypothetical protein
MIFPAQRILIVLPRQGCFGEAGIMSDSTQDNRPHSMVGVVAEYVVTGMIMLMTLVSTLRMLGI